MSLIGNLEDLSLPDILQIVSLSRKSGILQLEREGERGKIIIRQGMVIQTVSPRAGRTLGEILAARGIVSPEALRGALELQRAGENRELLGSILVRQGLIAEPVLEKIVQEQIEDAIASFLSWKEGTFRFELADIRGRGEFSVDPQAFILERGIDTQWLVMEGTRVIDERSRAAATGPPSRDVKPAATETEEVPPLAPPESAGPQAPRTPQAAERARLEAALEDVRAALARGSRDAAAADLSREEGALLRDMLGELQNPGAASEIGLLILRFAAEMLNRAVLFVVRDGAAAGLGGFGVEVTGSARAKGVRGVLLPLDTPSILEEAVRGRAPVSGPVADTPANRKLYEQLGGAVPLRALAVPLVSAGKVRVLLYGDNIPDEKPLPRTTAFELFFAQAGLALEAALLERRLDEADRPPSSGDPAREGRSGG